MKPQADIKNITFYCIVENILSNSCGLPPYIMDAFVEIENDTVNYHCRDGYTANQSMNTAHCINGQWTQLSLGCISKNKVLNCSDLLLIIFFLNDFLILVFSKSCNFVNCCRTVSLNI